MSGRPNPFIALTFLLHRFGSEDSVILQKDFSILRTLMNYWFLMEMCTMMPIFLRLVHVVVIRTTDLMGPSLMTIASRWQNFWAPSTLACCCSFSRIIHCPVHLMWLFHYGIKKRERIHMLYSYADWCSLLLLRSNPDPLPWVRFLEPHCVDHLMIIQIVQNKCNPPWWCIIKCRFEQWLIMINFYWCGILGHDIRGDYLNHEWTGISLGEPHGGVPDLLHVKLLYDWGLTL